MLSCCIKCARRGTEFRQESIEASGVAGLRVMNWRRVYMLEVPTDTLHEIGPCWVESWLVRLLERAAVEKTRLLGRELRRMTAEIFFTHR